MKLVPACGYKGSKRKFATAIAQRITSDNPTYVFDLCCGSGSVTLALIELGFPPERLTVVEAGLWGAYWQAISCGSFDLGRLRKLLIDDLPADPRDVAKWVEQDVGGLPPSPETFIVLQAAAYGAIPTWWDGEKWRHDEPRANRVYHARPFWQPGPTSKEKKPRGTIFNPKQIVLIVAEHMKRCAGLRVIYGDIITADLSSPPKTVYYMDPPYSGVTGYGHSFDVMEFIQRGPRPLIVSEGIQLPGAAEVVEVGSRRRGNVTKGANERKCEAEYLNIFI